VGAVEAEDRFSEGAIIAGKYSLTHTLGQGGMGLVVAATHLQLERRVAIKFLLPQHLEKQEVVSRFTREARAAAKIQSDHVAHVLDVGVDEGTPYMVMEYLEGEDLKQIISRRGPLAVEEAVRYIMHACEALAEAHSLGIVHRDLKPANLFLANRPNGKSILKVLDFGISKIMNPATETELTLTSKAVGSPSYMSPEQLASSRSLDGRADIWALGVVLYEMLARRRPFFGETMPNIVAQILKGAFEPLDTLRPDLPLAVVAAVHKCLELDPAARFSSVSELTLALAPFAPTESTSNVDGVPRATAGWRASIRPVDESGFHQTGVASTVSSSGLQKASAPRRTKLLRVAAAGAFTSLAALAAVAFFISRTTQRELGAASGAASGQPVVHQPQESPPSVPSAVTTPEPAPVALSPSNAPEPSASAALPSTPLPPAVHTTAAASRATQRAQKATAPPAAASSAPSPSGCHLVSYFDALGDKHFKQECP
jgi:serine/threonine-protein kinase